MVVFRLRVPIAPVAKARPRFRMFGSHVSTFTPQKTAEYEAKIAEHYLKYTKNHKFERDTALYVNLIFGMPIPKSTPKSRQQAMSDGVIKPTKKPDIDNLCKAVLDALNGVAWDDDSQIVKLSAAKEYSRDPYVSICIHEWVE